MVTRDFNPFFSLPGGGFSGKVMSFFDDETWMVKGGRRGDGRLTYNLYCPFFTNFTLDFTHSSAILSKALFLPVGGDVIDDERKTGTQNGGERGEGYLRERKE